MKNRRTSHRKALVLNHVMAATTTPATILAHVRRGIPTIGPGHRRPKNRLKSSCHRRCPTSSGHGYRHITLTICRQASTTPTTCRRVILVLQVAVNLARDWLLLACHSRAAFFTPSAALDAFVHVADGFATVRARFANLCAGFAVMRVEVAVTAHEIDAGCTGGNAVEHQLHMALFGVVAALA